MATAALSSDAATKKIALLGGVPACGNRLHVGRPNVGDRERFLSQVSAMLDRNWRTNDGPHVEEFEARVVDLVGAKHGVAMCNATVGLKLASSNHRDCRRSCVGPSVDTANFIASRESTACRMEDIVAVNRRAAFFRP